jgi:predicted RNase H-like nuclease
MTMDVAGIDACPKGWVAVTLRRGQTGVATGSDLAELVERLEPLEVIAIDMPIGLPTVARECDKLARAFVRPRHNSVFPTPPGAVLAESSFELACERVRELLGHGISRQTWALRDNIAVVEGLAHDARYVEVHPEVSFRALIGVPVQWPKTTWNGQTIRKQALAGVVIGLPGMLDEAATVPPADVLDAAVAAWSASRYATYEAQALPASAGRGQRQVIWY